MKDTQVKKSQKPTATFPQIFDISNSIAGSIGKLLLERNFSFAQAKELLEDVGKTAFNEVGRQVVEKLLQLAPADVTSRYKKDLETFFLKVHGLTIDISAMRLPTRDGYDHYMVVPADLDEDAIFAAFKKAGLRSSKYMNGSIVKNKGVEQSRPTESYAFAHKGCPEPDSEHLNRSYDQYSIDGKTYLTIKEYMLIHQFMWWKFNIRLDEKGWTRTTTLDSVGNLMCGDWYDDRFELGYGNRDRQFPDDGPRSAVLS